jgi:hypothetical protein
MTERKLVGLTLTLLLAAGAGGCSSIAESTSPTPPPRSTETPLAARAVAVDAIDFSDAMARLIPSLDDTELAIALETRFRDYGEALRAGDTDKAGTALAKITSLLSKGGVHPATLGAIRLAVLAGEESLGAESIRQADSNAAPDKR